MTAEENEQLPEVAITDRRAGERNDRRAGMDRRKKQVPVPVERRTGEDRRQHGERRRQVDPTTCERDYNDDEITFMKAMDQYKRDNRRRFPTLSEVLEVVRALGYRVTAAPSALPGLPIQPPPVAESK